MTENSTKNVLVLGYGNPARGDDGLGPAAAEAIEELEIDGVTVDSNYQLTVEDAAAVAEHDYAVFVDASMKGEEPFSFSRLSPKHKESFSSHSVEPETVLGLSKDLFNASTEAYILGIRGYSFDMFNETMTK
ncbi:hydrogenase maturation protease, partial [Candidatus Latescibacterota bacterium]